MPGLDTNTKLLLHCDGADESTSFPDESDSNHTVTAEGTAQVDTAIKKWGTGSLLLDGDSDYLTIPNSADWAVIGSNSEIWTIDFQMRLDLHATSENIIVHFEDASNYWKIFHNHGNGLRFITVGGASIDTGYAGEITDNDLHHIVVIIKGTGATKDIGLYKDGIQIGYVQSASIYTYSGLLYIGQNGDSGAYLDGNIDEIRIQNSNYFNASPVVGLTDTIDVPTEAYSAANPNNTYVICSSQDPDVVDLYVDGNLLIRGTDA